MPPKGRKKAAVTKSYSAEVDAKFPPIEKILQEKSQPAKSGRGRKKADAADDETIIVGQVGIVEGDGDVGNGISNGTKMNGGGTPNNEEKMDPFDRLLLEGTTKKDDWRLEFSPDASRMSPKNGAERESGDLESDDGDFKSNSKTSSVVAEAGSTRAKEDIEQVSDEEAEDPEIKDTPEEADEDSEEVLEKSSDKKAVEEESEEEIEEAQEEDEPKEPNVEVEKVPEKRGRKKVVEKAPEEDIEEVEKTEEPEKAVGRRGRKKAEVVAEEPKKALAKRGRKKAEIVEEQEEIDDDDEPEEEKPTAKRGRKKGEIPEEVDDDEMEEEKEKPMAKRGRKKLEDVEKEKTEEEPPKSKRGRKKAEVLDIADEESEKEQEKPAPKRGRRKAEVEVVEIPDEKSEEEEQEKPKGRRGRPAKPAEVQIEDSQEPEKPRAMRGRKKAEVVELEEEKQATKRGRKKAEVPEAAEEPERTTGKRGRKKAEVVEAETVEEPAKGKKGRKRKVDVPESPSKRGKEDYDEDDISDFAGKELRVAMTRSQEIDEMARKASPTHKEAGNVQKPSDETYVMAKPAKEQPAKSGRKRANQDATDAKPEKSQKEEPAKQGKSGAKRAQIPDVSALDFGSDAKTTDDQPWNFKIASWNVNGVRAWLEKGGMSYLEHEDPDVLCIQETKCSKDKLPEELEIDGYHCHWLAGDKDGYSGVGLISKTKPVSISEGIGIEEHDNEGRVITAEFEKFYLVNTYVPNAGRGLVRLDYRKTWDVDFRAYLKKLDNKKPVVLCGDLNVAHEEIDIANPKSNKKNAGFTQEERDGFSSLLEEGFIDTFRHLYPDEKGAYTFWTYMMNCRAKNVGWRLDYFVISERFKDHLCDSVIRKDVMGSDHCPVGLLLHI